MTTISLDRRSMFALGTAGLALAAADEGKAQAPPAPTYTPKALPFDPKAVWLNAEHIRTMPVEELADRLMPFVGHLTNLPTMLRITPLIRERIRLLRDVLTVPCDCGWSDLGSWEAVYEFRGGLDGANVVTGPGQSVEGGGNLIVASGKPIRVVGLSDVVVVDAPEGILVMRRGASDALRKSVEKEIAR